MSKRVLMIIAPDQFRDEEMLQPREIFQREGWLVDIASTRLGEATGMLGAKHNVTLTLEDVRAENYDAVVVVGGMGSPEHLWNNTRLHALLNTQHDERQVISAICLSGAVLANAGVLKGKCATVWETPESLEALEKGGAEYTGEPVTVDGHIVTANGPEAADDFGRAVVAQVKNLLPA